MGHENIKGLLLFCKGFRRKDINITIQYTQLRQGFKGNKVL